MCSWCWGYRPVWQQLKAALPSSVRQLNLVGGLAPDTDEVMPADMQRRIQGFWRQIKEMLGTEFNFDFWTENHPRRATYMSCRAVVAAALQGAEEPMIEAIQRGYYLQAKNPSEIEVLIAIAESIGLDGQQFLRDLMSGETEQEFQRQMNLVRSMPVAGFPSLVLVTPTGVSPVPVDYYTHEPTLQAIEQLLLETG